MIFCMLTAQREQTSSLEFAPTPEFPALQYLDRVDKGSAAEKVGLKAKDFLLEVTFILSQPL